MAPGGFQEYYYEEGIHGLIVVVFTLRLWAIFLKQYNTNNLNECKLFHILSIGTNSTITIADGVTVEVFENSRGVFGANSFVEYNKDLYILDQILQ